MHPPLEYNWEIYFLQASTWMHHKFWSDFNLQRSICPMPQALIPKNVYTGSAINPTKRGFTSAWQWLAKFSKIFQLCTALAFYITLSFEWTFYNYFPKLHITMAFNLSWSCLQGMTCFLGLPWALQGRWMWYTFNMCKQRWWRKVAEWVQPFWRNS
jgi:hypothetical protein